MTRNDLIDIIGANLKKYRMERGYTQEELAEKASISASFYANLESCKKSMSVLNIRQLADSLEVNVDSLMYESSSSTRLESIIALLNDKPEWFIMSIDKMVRLCIDDFLNRDEERN